MLATVQCTLYNTTALRCTQSVLYHWPGLGSGLGSCSTALADTGQGQDVGQIECVCCDTHDKRSPSTGVCVVYCVHTVE